MRFVETPNGFPRVVDTPEGVSVLVAKPDAVILRPFRELSFIQRWQFRRMVKKARKRCRSLRNE
jgi:hypothetical protein